MDGVPLWLIAAFQNRIDVLGERMQASPNHRTARKQASELFEQLLETFSEEQRRQFDGWEDRIGLQESIEREEMYVRGFLDGFQMYASLNEMISQISSEERFGNAETSP